MQGLLVEPFAALVTHKLVYLYGHVVCTFWPTMRVMRVVSQLKGPHRSLGVHIPNLRGHTEVWESVSPTQGASNVEERTTDRLSSIAPLC